MFQPLTHREVVELVGPVGHEDGEHEDADGNEDVGTEWGIFMTISPRHLHVNERIMCDVKGIGYFT